MKIFFLLLALFFSASNYSQILTGEPIKASDILALQAEITNLQNQINNLSKVYGGSFSFSNGNCTGPISGVCSIDLTSGGFTSSPNCTISMKNMDGTGYHEVMILSNTTKDQLNIWRGQYYNSGTTMQGSFICVQNAQ